MNRGREPGEASGLNDDSDDLGSGLDDLFAEEKFVEYEDDGLNPFVAPRQPETGPDAAPATPTAAPATPTPEWPPTAAWSPAASVPPVVVPPVVSPVAPPVSTSPPVAGTPSGVPLSVTPIVEWPSSEAHDPASGPAPLPPLPSRREQRLADAPPLPAEALSTEPPLLQSPTTPSPQPQVAPLVRPRSSHRSAAPAASSAPAPTASTATDSPRSRRAPLRLVWASLSTLQRSLVVVAGLVLLVLVLVGLFALGRGLPSPAPDDGAGAPAGDDSGTGPLAPGEHAWNTLRGGECVDPYDTVWAEKFTVVDCAQPHGAQIVSRGIVGADVVEYPALEGWQALVPTLCDTTTLLDLEAAGAYTDLQVELGYPGTVEAWDGGDRDYYCFVSRSAGAPIEGSLLAAP